MRAQKQEARLRWAETDGKMKWYENPFSSFLPAQGKKKDGDRVETPTSCPAVSHIWSLIRFPPTFGRLGSISNRILKKPPRGLGEKNPCIGVREGTGLTSTILDPNSTPTVCDEFLKTARGKERHGATCDSSDHPCIAEKKCVRVGSLPKDVHACQQMHEHVIELIGVDYSCGPAGLTLLHLLALCRKTHVLHTSTALMLNNLPLLDPCGILHASVAGEGDTLTVVVLEEGVKQTAFARSCIADYDDFEQQVPILPPHVSCPKAATPLY